MTAVFGLHIGNSSACLAISKDKGKTEIVANDAGDRVTPAIISWSPSGSLVGSTAYLQSFHHSAATIIKNKVFLHELDDDSIEKANEESPYKIYKSGKGFKYELVYNGKQHHITSKEIALLLLRRMYGFASTAVANAADIPVVLTVPAYFNQQAIDDVKECASKAGFVVLQIIDEPCAAALGVGLGQSLDENSIICLVYRLGGFSLDATVIQVEDGMFTILCSVSKLFVGGQYFTNKLSDFLEEEHKRQHKGSEISERGKFKVNSAAENAKQILSIQNSASCNVESVGSGYDLNINITRARFESLICGLIMEYVSPVQGVLDQAGKSVNDISKVVLCGGSTKIPKIQENFKQKFANSDIIVDKGADEVIAMGAALHASYAAKCLQLPQTLYHDLKILHCSINLVLKSEEEEIESYKIENNLYLPLSKTFVFTPRSEYKLLKLEVKKEFILLGPMVVEEISEECDVKIMVDIDEDGVLFIQLLVGDNSNSLYFDLNQKTV